MHPALRPLEVHPYPMELSQTTEIHPEHPAFTYVSVNPDKTFRVADVNADALIEEVRTRKVLWDRQLPKHANQPFAQSAWQEISVKMGIPATVLRKKWKNLRDNFGVELTKVPESQWAYFQKLYFLKGYVKPRERAPPAEPEEDPLAVDPLAGDPVEPPQLGPDLEFGPSLLITADGIKEEPVDSEIGEFPVIPLHPFSTATTVHGDSDLEPPKKKSCSGESERNPLATKASNALVSSKMNLDGSKSQTRNFDQNPNSVDAATNTTLIPPLLVDSHELPKFSDTYLSIQNVVGNLNASDQNSHPNNTSASKEQKNLPEVSIIQKPRALKRNKNDPPVISRNTQVASKEVNQNKNPKRGNAAKVSIYFTEDETSEETTEAPFEDEDFFRSLLPHVMKIPSHLKLRFRNKVLELVEEFAYSGLQ